MIRNLYTISIGLFKFINNKLLFSITFLIYIIDVVLLLAIPIISAKLIDALALNVKSAFNYYLYILIGITFLRITTYYIANILTIKITEDFGYNLRKTIFNNILKLSFLEFEKKSIGDYTSRLFNDSSKLKGFFTSYVLSLTIDILFLIVLAIILIKMNLLLAIILFIFIPISLYSGLIFKKRISLYSKENQEKLGFLTNKVYSWLSVFIFIKAYEITNIANNQYIHSDNDFKKISIKQGVFNGFVNSLNMLLLSIPTVIIIIFGGIQYFDNKLSIGILFAFITYSSYFSLPIQRIISIIIVETPKLVPIYNRIESFISDYSCSLKSYKESDIECINNSEKILIKEINHSYNSVFYLKVNDLKLIKGKVIGLRGANGSGKSTIAKIISGIIPSSCIFQVSGFILDRLSYCTFMFSQNQVLFDGSLVENISLFEENPNLSKINEIIKLLNLYDILNIKSEINYIFDFTNKHSFSTGQVQKIALARLFYTQKKILILDEPETSLDNINIKLLLTWLTSQTDRFVLVISHNSNVLNVCDNIYALYENTNKSFILKQIPL